MSEARPSWARSGGSGRCSWEDTWDGETVILSFGGKRALAVALLPTPQPPPSSRRPAAPPRPTRPRLCVSGSRDLPHSSPPRDIPAVPLRVMSHGGETLRTALPFIHCRQERSDRPDLRPTGASRNWGESHRGGASLYSTLSDASRGSRRAALQGQQSRSSAASPGPTVSRGLKACLLPCRLFQMPTGFEWDRWQSRELRIAGIRGSIVPGESGRPCLDFQVVLS